MSRTSIRMLRRGQVVELLDVGPNETLLDYLRLREGRCGTKEGCAEGDCGACTVAIGTRRNGTVHYEPVNSCIYLLGMADGKDVVAVDDLSEGDVLHPVQQAMVDHHGSQCGFCTSGFVMSLFTLYHAGVAADRQSSVDWIAGNLCRCTGYRPIVDAALASCDGTAVDGFSQNKADIVRSLTALDEREDVFVGTDDRFFAAPASVDALADLYNAHPDATIVAGATDVGLWITKQLRDLPKIIHVGRARGFDAISEQDDHFTIGAGATYAQADSALGGIDPDIAEVIRRIGSKQVRASGTVGGNIANGSPIGDTPPVLIALEARLELRKGTSSRTIDLEDFFIDYGVQDRAPGELVTAVHVPKLKPDQVFRSYKISKRFDQDISAVLAAFRFSLEDDVIVSARVAYGGMAATPKRAAVTEAALQGLSLRDRASWQAVAEELSGDFQPITDMRASADYRMRTAKALLLKALREVSGEKSRQTRVIGEREGAALHAV